MESKQLLRRSWCKTKLFFLWRTLKRTGVMTLVMRNGPFQQGLQLSLTWIRWFAQFENRSQCQCGDDLYVLKHTDECLWIHPLNGSFKIYNNLRLLWTAYQIWRRFMTSSRISRTSTPAQDYERKLVTTLFYQLVYFVQFLSSKFKSRPCAAVSSSEVSCLECFLKMSHTRMCKWLEMFFTMPGNTRTFSLDSYFMRTRMKKTWSQLTPIITHYTISFWRSMYLNMCYQ